MKAKLIVLGLSLVLALSGLGQRTGVRHPEYIDDLYPQIQKRYMADTLQRPFLRAAWQISHQFAEKEKSKMLSSGTESNVQERIQEEERNYYEESRSRLLQELEQTGYGRNLHSLSMNASFPIPVDKDDSLALVALYNALDGSNWINKYGWLTKPVADWYGITLNGNRVSGIELNTNRLAGDIPSEIEALDSLESLHLYGNNILNIPQEMGHLQYLRILDLRFNPLNDNFPPQILDLKNLEWLDLEQCGITGEVPTEIKNLTNLSMLSLGMNHMSGEIPIEIGELIKLKILILGSNYFIGSIPMSIGKLLELEILILQSPDLSGTIPEEIGNLKKLRELIISATPIYGEIPLVIFNLRDLELINFGNCRLSGDIPAEIGNLKKLKYLHLNGNEFSGSVPDEIGNLLELRMLSLSDNRFVGSIPNSIGLLKNLTSFWASLNDFDGSIPEDFFNLVLLDFLDISHNNIEGGISERIEDLVSLNTLDLSENSISGSLPSGITELKYLWSLGLSGNALMEGNIPLNIIDLPLDNVGFHGTNLCEPKDSAYHVWKTGLWFYSAPDGCPLPINTNDSLALVQIYYENNGETWSYKNGWLQDAVSNWEGVKVENGRVIGLDLSYNGINGELSSAILKLSKLRSLIVTHANINRIPSNIDSLKELNYLSLDNNLLDELPDGICDLRFMRYISVMNNRISGLPSCIDNLDILYWMNLVGNELTRVPVELLKLPYLQFLWLIDNNIESLSDTLDLSSSNLGELILDYNRLDFADFEPHAGESKLPALYQKEFTSNEVVYLQKGSAFSRSASVGGSANKYQWFANGVAIEGATDTVVTIYPNETTSLVCRVTSDLVPNLELYSGEFLAIIVEDVELKSSSIIYIGQSTGVSSSDIDGKNWTSLMPFLEPHSYDVGSSNGKFYFVDVNDKISSIVSVDWSGANLDTLYRSTELIRTLHLDYENEYIYFSSGCCSGNSSSIKRMALDGSNETVIVSGIGVGSDVEVDLVNNFLFWIAGTNRYYNGESRLMRSDLNGDDIQLLTRIGNGASNLQVDGESKTLFWTEHNTSSSPWERHLFKSDLEGGNVDVLVASDIQAYSIFPREQRVIFAATDSLFQSNNTIMSVRFDGTGLYTLDTLKAEPFIMSMAILDEPQIPSVALLQPNEGDTLIVGEKYEIIWSAEHMAANDSLVISWSIDGGINYVLIASGSVDHFDGTYAWTVPDELTESGRIRVSNITKGVSDESDSNFSIIPAPSVTLLIPNGGEVFYVDSIYQVTWSSVSIASTDEIELSMSTDGGISYSEVASGTFGDFVGSYSWTVSDELTASGRMRVSNITKGVSDESDGNFSIIPAPSVMLISPNGGEVHFVDSTYQIAWSSVSEAATDAMELSLSTDGGDSYSVVASGTFGDFAGSYSWTVPDELTASGRIRVSNITQGVSDESDGNFSIAVYIPQLSNESSYLKNLRLYPSPTPGPLSLEFEVYRKLSSLKMEIWNLQGTRLHLVELDHRKGVQRANLDLTAYEAGVYFVVFTDDEGTFRQQVKVTRE